MIDPGILEELTAIEKHAARLRHIHIESARHPVIQSSPKFSRQTVDPAPANG
jgi:hypothetical protein